MTRRYATSAWLSTEDPGHYYKHYEPSHPQQTTLTYIHSPGNTEPQERRPGSCTASSCRCTGCCLCSCRSRRTGKRTTHTLLPYDGRRRRVNIESGEC